MGMGSLFRRHGCLLLCVFQAEKSQGTKLPRLPRVSVLGKDRFAFYMAPDFFQVSKYLGRAKAHAKP